LPIATSGEGAADRHDAEAAQARQIERRVVPVRLEARKGRPDRPPLRRRDELSPLGLPWPDNVGGAQVEVVALAAAKDVDLDAGPFSGIDHASVQRQVEGDLDEATVVLERDIAAHPQRRPPGDMRAVAPQETPPMTRSAMSSQSVPIVARGGSSSSASMMLCGAAIVILPQVAEMSVPQSTGKTARRVLVPEQAILKLIRTAGRMKAMLPSRLNSAIGR
jgi:hypothetical protein